MKKVLFITGLYGCSCSPYTTWAECEEYHRRIFSIGDGFTHRCTGKHGIVTKAEGSFFWISKYDGENNVCLTHSANMNPDIKQLKLF